MTDNSHDLDPEAHMNAHRTELRRRTLLKGIGGTGAAGALLPGLFGDGAAAGALGAQSEPDPDELPDEFTASIGEFTATLVDEATDMIKDMVLEDLKDLFNSIEEAVSGAKEILSELVLDSAPSGLTTAIDKIDWLDDHLDDLPGALAKKAKDLNEEDEEEDDSSDDDEGDSSDDEGGDSSESISPEVIVGSGASEVITSRSTGASSASGFLDDIKDAAEDVKEAAEDTIDSVAGAIVKSFDNLSDEAVDAAKTAWGTVSDAANAIASYVTNGVRYLLNQILSPLFSSLASVDLPPLGSISSLLSELDSSQRPSIDEVGFADHIDIDSLVSSGLADGLPTASSSSSTSPSSGNIGATRLERAGAGMESLASQSGSGSSFIGGDTVSSLCELTDQFDTEDNANREDHEWPYAFEDKRDLAINVAEEEINNWLDENAETTKEVGPVGIDGGFTLQDLSDPDDVEDHPCDFRPNTTPNLAPGIEINFQGNEVDTGTTAEIYPIFEFRVNKICLHVAVMAEQTLPVSVEDIWDGISYALGEAYAAARSAAEILEVSGEYRSGYNDQTYLGNYAGYSQYDTTTVEDDPVTVATVEADTESIASDLSGIREKLEEIQENNGLVTDPAELVDELNLTAVDEELAQFQDGGDEGDGMSGVKDALSGPNEYAAHVELYWIAEEMGITGIPPVLEKIGKEGEGLRGDSTNFDEVGLNALYLVDDVSTQRTIRQWVDSLPETQQEAIATGLAARTNETDSGDSGSGDGGDDGPANIVERLGYEGPSSDGVVGRQLSMLINNYWSWFAEDYLDRRLWQKIENTCNLDNNLPPLEWESCQLIRCDDKSKYRGEPVQAVADTLTEESRQSQEEASEDGGEGSGDKDWIPDKDFPGSEYVWRVITFLLVLGAFLAVAAFIGSSPFWGPLAAGVAIVAGGVIIIAALLRVLQAWSGTGFGSEVGRRL